jgi:hypothetical protein
VFRLCLLCAATVFQIDKVFVCFPHFVHLIKSLPQILSFQLLFFEPRIKECQNFDTHIVDIKM